MTTHISGTFCRLDPVALDPCPALYRICTLIFVRYATAERAGLAPGLQRRGLLVLLETLGPALAAHICSEASTGFGGSIIRSPGVTAPAEGATSVAAAGSWVAAGQASVAEVHCALQMPPQSMKSI